MIKFSLGFIAGVAAFLYFDPSFYFEVERVYHVEP